MAVISSGSCAKETQRAKFPNINVIAISKGVGRKAFDNIHLMNGKKLKVVKPRILNFIQAKG